MSFTQDKITDKYINGSLRESNSVYYGEIVGKGSAICSFENTVNVRIFKGNNKLDASKDGEVLKNVPFLVSSSTVAPKWEVGETVVVGFLNSDANAPYIIVKNSPFSTSVSGSNSSGDPASDGIDFSIGDVDLGNENANYMLGALIEAGTTVAGACGILANVQAESGFSTALNSGNNGAASGICQWHPDRWANCVTHCKEKNLDPTTIQGQTSFLIKELQAYKDLWALILSAEGEQGAYDVAYKMCYEFERPADKEAKSKQRGDMAKAMYNDKLANAKITVSAGQSVASLKQSIFQKVKSDWSDVEEKCKFIDVHLIFKNTLNKRTSTTRVVIHHSDGNATLGEVHKQHIDRGWDGIGYHFYIDKQGNAYIGRYIDKEGAHAKQHNGDSIGVCFQGKYDEEESMPQAQLEKGIMVIMYLKKKYGKLGIYRHKDLLAQENPKDVFHPVNLTEVAKPQSVLFDEVQRKKWMAENGYQEETSCPGKYFPFKTLQAFMEE